MLLITTPAPTQSLVKTNLNNYEANVVIQQQIFKHNE